MVKGIRDEFSSNTKHTIAMRVNSRCSNPTCGAPTYGPTQNPAKHLNIGVAAHITAASPRGPRYNPALTPEERSSPENGLWLCQNCAKLNDNDPSRFPEHLLRHWKATAEANALDNIGRRSPFDREEAPQLVVYSSLDDAQVSSTSVIFPSDVIQSIRHSSPQRFFGAEQVRLLCHGVGRSGHPYAILGLGSNFDRDWKVLLFAEGKLGWDLIADTSLESQKGYVPEVRYIPGSPGALVLTYLVMWGTGVLRRTTSWYRIAQGQLIPLLSYPHYFHVAGWGMPFSRTLTTKSLEIPATLSPGALLKLEFEIKYGIFDSKHTDNGDDELFTIIETLSLEWNKETQKFAPKTGADDFAQIEDFWNESTEQFIERNRSHLERLAHVGTHKQRQFITEHLLQ
jgi:hypothetical protein